MIAGRPLSPVRRFHTRGQRVTLRKVDHPTADAVLVIHDKHAAAHDLVLLEVL